MGNEENYEFKAEIQKLLNILSKSLYQHKEIFLRELISNASDALKKIHFISLSNQDIEGTNFPLEINITVDPKAKTFVISDTGVGMTKSELIDNLGTIASSGSEKFVKNLKDTEKNKDKPLDLDVIGQFGVGFYSVFMVADKVKVISKSYLKNEPSHMWESEGAGNFKVSVNDRSTRGTDIILFFKDDEVEFLSQYKVEEVIKKYSNFIPFPIFVTEIKEPEKKEEKKDESKSDEKKEELNTEGKKEEELKTEEKKEEEKTPERKAVNETEPLWRKSPSEIKEDQYKTLYHFISKKYDDYAHVINYNVDGRVQFRSITFIPGSKSQDMFHQDFEFGPTLYAKNVMVMEHCKDLIPQWMRFTHGIVDSEDFQNIINISRETVQSNRVIMKISELLVKKIVGDLQSTAEKEPEKYKKIWQEFGTMIKEGVVTDQRHKDDLLKLIRFNTSKTNKDNLIGFDEYVKNMQPDQKEIFYLVGENLDTLRLSPHLGFYHNKNIEVIFFTEPVDNFLMMNIRDFKKMMPKAAAKTESKEEKKEEEKKEDEKKEETEEEVSFPFVAIDTTDKDKTDDKKKEGKDGEKKEEESQEDKNLPEPTKKFLTRVKEILGDKITDAKITDRLYGNACRLANPSIGMSSSMQRAMRYWTVSQMGKDFEIPRKIMEFNQDHPIVKSLIEIHAKSPASPRMKAIVTQMFENCLLSEGDLPNPSLIVPRINQILEMLLTGNDDVKNPIEEREEKEKAEKAEKERVEKEKAGPTQTENKDQSKPEEKKE